MRAGLRRSLQERWLLPRLVADVLSARPPPSQPRAERPATAGGRSHQHNTCACRVSREGPRSSVSDACMPSPVSMRPVVKGLGMAWRLTSMRW